jgi:uncharacterized membrane protein
MRLIKDEEQTISTNRIEAFSDGVFAIVITLLVLELRVPHIEHGQDFGELAAAVWKLAPRFLSFLLSFVFVAIFWATHHQLFNQLTGSTRGLLWMNNLFLLFLTFIPFPTALLGEYPDNTFAVVFFGMAMIASVSAFVLMRWYVSYKAKLLSPEIGEPQIKSALRNGLFSILAYAIAVFVALVNTKAAIATYVLIPFLYLLLQRKRKIDER